jgi:hypothetical protein
MKQKELINLINEIVQRVISEETGLTKAFDKTINLYRDLLLKKQTAMSEFVKNYKDASGDAKKQQSIKEKHVANMKKLDGEIEAAQDKANNAIDNLEPDEEI